MIFRLYTGDVGGEPLWEENWSGPNSVEVSDGLFSVRLGSLTPIPESVVNNNNNLWLGITVGTDDEMEPRIQLGSVPYSHMAQNVPDGSITADKINDGAVTTGKVLDNSITTNKVVNGSITLDKIADNTVNSAKIVDGSISNADIANGSITTTKLAVGAASHITLLSEPITVVSFHSRTTERTALNLSAIVPASAVGVIINLETNGKAYAWVPGTNNASLTAQDWGFNQGWVRLVNQSIDYQMIEGSTSGSDLLITVVGYLE